MKIYTKSGDKGKTSLFGGTIINKDDIRIEAYGTVDELNTFIGQLLYYCEDEASIKVLTMVQNKLFNIGSVLATAPESNFKMPSVDQSHVQGLEQAIDQMETVLPPLKNFILPAGSLGVVTAHICRTVCRRAERRVVTLGHHSEVDATIIQFLNRLSDYFFVLSRYIGHQGNEVETIWKSE